MHAKKYLDVNQLEHIPESHDLITWRVSAYAVVTHEDKILLVKEDWSNNYELPGGGIESGEAITSGVIRECQEETGVSIAL
ncbi:MAG TPA: NUDIX domain-containing protein, partial [Candidatus Saccharimonadales bacterium]